MLDIALVTKSNVSLYKKKTLDHCNALLTQNNLKCLWFLDD